MNIADLKPRYQAMDDGDLLALSVTPDQLTPEALVSLREELRKRRINPQTLSDEQRQVVKARNGLERHWNPDGIYFFWPRLRHFVARVKDWQQFRRQTGRIPALSILGYFLHMGFAVFTLAMLIWYVVQHHWSSWAWIGLVAPLAIADSFFSDWLLGKIRIHEIASYRSNRRPRR